MSSFTTSKARSIPWWKKPRRPTWQSSLWQERQRRVQEKGERGIGVILTQSRGQPKERDMGTNVQSFSRLSNAGSAVSLGHKSFECRSGWNRRQGWDSYGSYSSRPGGQAYWQSWDWRRGYQGQGWSADDWGRSTASSSAAPPPEPARPPSTSAPMPAPAAADAPATEATGSTPATEQGHSRYRECHFWLQKSTVRSTGQPHFKRTYNDGTVEYESW